MRRPCLYIILFFILYSFISFGQSYESEQFNKSEYLDVDNFNDFCQGENLLIYFASNKGIIQFDNYNFSSLKSLNQKIEDLNIQSIAIMDSILYFSNKASLYSFNLRNQNLKTLLNEEVNNIKSIGQYIYFNSIHTLYEIDTKNSGSLKRIFQNDQIKISTWNIDRERILIGSNQGLFDNNGTNQFKRSGAFLEVIAISKDIDNAYTLLGNINSKNPTLFKYNESSINTIKELPGLRPTDLYLSDEGNMWISSEKGNLALYTGLLLKTIGKESLGFFPFNIQKLKADKESNLWLLGKNGLAYIKVNHPFTKYNNPNTRHVNYSNNELIIINNTEIYVQPPTESDYNFSHKLSLSDGSLNTFNLNNKWYISFKGKLYGVKDKQLIEEKLTYSNLSISKIGQLLIGIGEEGVFNLKTDFSIAEVLYSFNDKLLKTWSDDEYLYIYFKSGKIISINESLDIKELDYDIEEINEIDQISFQSVISFNDSTIHYQSNGSKNISINIKDFSARKNVRIYNVVLSSKDELWVSSGEYIYHLNINPQDPVNPLKDFEKYNEKDFFISTYFQNAFVLNNSIYFIHENGITTFNDLLNSTNLTRPGIRINNAYGYLLDQFSNSIDTVDLLNDPEKQIILNPNNAIAIDADVISFNEINKSAILYRVAGLNQDWKRVENNETLLITNLPSGQHIIEIKAVNSDNIESSYTKNIEVSIDQPFYNKLWFYLIILIIIVLISLIIYRSINNYKNNKTKELQEKLNKELGDLEKRSHLQILKAERLKQLNELITSQKSELEKKNIQIESQKYELSLTNQQIKKQKDLLEETSSKLKASINYAQRIQDALMSTEIEIKESIDESFVFFQPRDVVSGDFYWFNKVQNDKGEELLILAAVDCTGHGVPGAIVSVVGMNLLNTITNLKKVYDPGEILTELNADIIHNLRQNETQVNDGMDMTLVTINNSTKEIKFAGAKNPLMYIENGELIRIRGDKHAIGGQQRGGDRIFTTHSITTENEKRVYYLFSDGYQDQFGGEKGFKYLTSNFKKLLLEIHDKPVLDQKEILYKTINNWKGDYSQTDDMLVIGFKF